MSGGPLARFRGTVAEHVGADRRSPIWAEHVARYRHARRYGEPRLVLDVACGSGLGFEALTGLGAPIVAGDSHPAALAEAVASARDLAVHLTRLDVTALPYRAGCFDLVTCFETIEHIDHDHELVREVRRVVDDDGVVLISTPIRVDAGGTSTSNPFHVREYTATELLDLLRPRFSRISLLGQAPSAAFARSAYWSTANDAGTRARRVLSKVALRLPDPALRLAEGVRRRPLFPGPDDFVFDEQALAHGHAMLAVCRP